MNSLKRTIFLKIILLVFFILIILFSMNGEHLKTINVFQNNTEIIGIFTVAIPSIITLMLILSVILIKPSSLSTSIEMILSIIVIIFTLFNWVPFFENNCSISLIIYLCSLAEFLVSTAVFFCAIIYKIYPSYKEVQ